MGPLLEVTLDGVALGASYGLLAVGFTLAFGVLRRVDLAYGASVMLGLYLALWLHQRFGLGALAMALACLAGTVCSAAYVERMCFRPHMRKAAGAAVAASFAIWMQLQEAATLLLPLHTYRFPSPLDDWSSSAAALRPPQMVALASAAALAGALWLLIHRSRFGRAVRAIVHDPETAACMGVDVQRVSTQVFLLVAMIGAAAGYLIVLIHGQITPMFAMWATLKGLAAAMLGGLGSLGGAVVGGLVLGVAEAHGQRWAGPQVRDLLCYGVLLAVLGLRSAWRRRHAPTGLAEPGGG
jgi:branched-chain amino acid transport system permease protein